MANNKMDGLTASDVSFSHDESKIDSSFDLSAEWRDWAGLPGHLLSDIAEKFTDMDDYVRFGNVCPCWESIIVQNMKNLGSPLLLVDPPPYDKDYPNRRALYSLNRKSVCNFTIRLPHTKICRGSAFGWLITMEETHEDCYSVQMHNPFLSCTIDLPPLDNIVQLVPDEDSGIIGDGKYLWKAVMTSDPSVSHDFIIMGIMSRFQGLAFFKPGNNSWTPIEMDWLSESKKGQRFADVIFFHKAGQFYGVTLYGVVLAVEFPGDEEEPKLVRVAPSPIPHPGFFNNYIFLVEDMASGDLFQVHRSEFNSKVDQNGKSNVCVRFRVFKLNPTEYSWTPVHNLGDKVLFVGGGYSVLRPVSDCRAGCVPNRIYYTSDPDWDCYSRQKTYKPVCDGIYNMEDGTVQQHYLSMDTTRRVFPATIWFEPFLSKPQPVKNSKQPSLDVSCLWSLV